MPLEGQFMACVNAFGFGSPNAYIDESQALSKGAISSTLEAYCAIAQFAWESAVSLLVEKLIRQFYISMKIYY